MSYTKRPESEVIDEDEIWREITQYERQYGMNSKEFLRAWNESAVPDTFETNSWAILLHFLGHE